MVKMGRIVIRLTVKGGFGGSGESWMQPSRALGGVKGIVAG